MNKLSKLIIAGLCGQLWVFFAFSFFAATFDFTQWLSETRLFCVLFSLIGSMVAIFVLLEGQE